MKARYLSWLTRLYLGVVKRLVKPISALSEFDEIASISLLLDDGEILKLSNKHNFYMQANKKGLLVYNGSDMSGKPAFAISDRHPYIYGYNTCKKVLGVVEVEYYERDQCCNCQYRHLT